MTTRNKRKAQPPEAGQAEPIYMPQPDGSVLICATQAECCPICKRMAYFLVNAKGRTTCAECAA